MKFFLNKFLKIIYPFGGLIVFILLFFCLRAIAQESRSQAFLEPEHTHFQHDLEEINPKSDETFENDFENEAEMEAPADDLPSPPFMNLDEDANLPKPDSIKSSDEDVHYVPLKRIKNEKVVFFGLDKISGNVHTFEVAINDDYTLGSLKITPRACYTSAVNEPDKTNAFVEIEEKLTAESLKKIFSGWMFLESPGLNALDHPVYDIWLKGCLNPILKPTLEDTTAAPSEEGTSASTTAKSPFENQ